MANGDPFMNPDGKKGVEIERRVNSRRRYRIRLLFADGMAWYSRWYDKSELKPMTARYHDEEGRC